MVQRSDLPDNDRVQLEQAQARELYCTWVLTKEKVLTPKRLAWIKKMYGAGADERIKFYMTQIKNGEIV